LRKSTRPNIFLLDSSTTGSLKIDLSQVDIFCPPFVDQCDFFVVKPKVDPDQKSPSLSSRSGNPSIKFFKNHILLVERLLSPDSWPNEIKKMLIETYGSDAWEQTNKSIELNSQQETNLTFVEIP
jgi:hypothetical protein